MAHCVVGVLMGEMSERELEALCPHGKGTSELDIAMGFASNKGGVCSCCHRMMWTWALDEDGRCGVCADSPSLKDVVGEEGKS